VQGPWPRPGSKEEGVLCCTVLVGNCTDYGLVLLLYGYGTESCFGIGGKGTGYCCKRSLTLISFDEQAQQQGWF
jgi:hypothetical protein